ncbi:MAG: SPFH domain-containing protein [Proteobacteria bacterium]|nr:SPFH domain-containing protein [Pseudomonadota bacterium]MBU4470725.1 SPFH domain-containing protein [Pseudomonadota bacterium]MCG2751547.1 SPFH domain-containing protein [Desulfobacteraceae bacterium]
MAEEPIDFRQALKNANPKFKIPKVELKLSRSIKIILVVIALLAMAYNMLFVYVHPNEYGIKVVRIGVNRGVQSQFYTAGVHLVIPGLHEMHRMPRDIQVLELTNFPSTAADAARKDKVAHIQTSDGFFVDVDASILYRIENPYLVFTKIGPGKLFEENGIIPKAEPALKETLGKLTTEDFYNSPRRVKKAEEARDRLNQELNSKGIRVEQVLVRYFRYSPEIQKNIEEKKLKDQLVFTNQAAARAAKEEAELKKIVQEGEVIVEVEMEQGHAYVTRKTAEKDLYMRAKKAEANLLVKLAEAEKVRLKNDALKGLGSERMVGLKMADVYKGLDLIVLPSDGIAGVNPLNLDKTLKLFDVRKGGDQ